MKKSVEYSDGIAPTRLNYVEFGKLMINMKLLNSNILLLKYKKSYGPVPELRRQTISDDLKNLLYYIIDTKNLNYESIRELEPNDNTLIMKILSRSGLDVTFRLDKKKATEDIDDVVERFKIIQGEINAGNDNEKGLLDEAISLLTKLKKHNKITQQQFDEIKIEIEQSI